MMHLIPLLCNNGAMERGKDLREKELGRDQAARYRIRVQGRIGRRWSDWFDGMTVVAGSEEHPADRPPHTTLSGRVADQAALLGLLGVLVTLGFPLLLVEHIPQDASSESHS